MYEQVKSVDKMKSDVRVPSLVYANLAIASQLGPIPIHTVLDGIVCINDEVHGNVGLPSCLWQQVEWADEPFWLDTSFLHSSQR